MSIRTAAVLTAFSLTLPSFSSAGVARTAAPDFPEAPVTATWKPPTETVKVDPLPSKQAEFEKTLNKIVKQSPNQLGLPSGVPLRVESVQTVPEAVGIPPMAFVRITQVIDNTPVAGTETTLLLQQSTSKSPIHYLQGRLYPELKSLPEKPVAAEEAERKVWEKLSKEMTRFETVSGGTWIRWIDGKWRTVQLFGVSPQNLVAAVDGNGEIFVWPGHVIQAKKTDSKKPS
jgi:hypothetical protein